VLETIAVVLLISWLLGEHPKRAGNPPSSKSSRRKIRRAILTVVGEHGLLQRAPVHGRYERLRARGAFIWNG
jgi:hypothetical protein